MNIKTIIKDINTVGVAVDKVSAIMSSNSSLDTAAYTQIGQVIDGLSAKQVALALSTQKLSDEELEQIIKKNDLISKYGAETLIKNGLLSANSSLLSSEKAINAEDVKEALTLAGIQDTRAELLISKYASVAADGAETTSKHVLIKSLTDELVSRGILSKEKANEILQSFGVVAGDVAEKTSKESLTAATWKLVKAQLASAATNPATWIVVAAGVIFGLVKGIDALTESTEEAGEAATAAKEKYEEIESEIENLKNKIK